MYLIMRSRIMELYLIPLYIFMVVFIIKHRDFPFFVALQPFFGPWPLFSFLILTQTAGLLGRGISPSQGLYINTGQHKHRLHTHTHIPNIRALSGIGSHDHSVRASEDSSCLKPRGYRDRHLISFTSQKSHCISITKTIGIMLLREIVVIYSEDHM
jgi:hypothetical protein